MTDKTAVKPNDISGEEEAKSTPPPLTKNRDSANQPKPDPNERYLRLLADFNNYRRRTEKEKRELGDYVRAQTYKNILPVMDDFDRLIKNIQNGENGLAEGIQLIYTKLQKILENDKMEKIDPLDKPFDPNQHEAFLMKPTENPELDNTVADVLEAGYQYKGKLIRPAKVAVAKYN